MQVEVVPFGEIEGRFLERLAIEIEKFFPSAECQIGEALEVPESAYHPNRAQYEAAGLLKHVNSIARELEGKALAVTEEDLFSDDLNFVFGQARRPGRLAVLSLHRLKPEFYGVGEDEKLFLERAVKEAVHELGHTFGLGHCGNEKCVMSFSNSIADVDAKKKSFCKSCRRKLSQTT